MTENKKPAPKRGISKARLLNATNATVKDYGLDGNSPIADLTDAIEQDIIKDALAKA